MKNYFILLSLIASLLNFSTASATSLRPLNLEQLSVNASLIFHGEVLSNEVRKDEQSGQIATFTTFRVIELIKGSSEETHTIKQLGGYLRESGIMLRVHGVPEYTIGSHYVVFLPEKSALGFSSPIGLHQGNFSVITENGEQIVTNGGNLAAQANVITPSSNTRKVQIPLAVSSENPTRSRLDDFINTVRAYNIQ